MHGAWFIFAAVASSHPYFEAPAGPKTVDLSAEARSAGQYVTGPVEQPDFSRLADPEATASRATAPGRLPDGWVQLGSVVVPEAVATGELTVDPKPHFAVEDIPGNAYPRKHTVYLNFTGGMLFTGTDNSAESRSSLAKQGMYPAFGGGEAKAVASVQAFETDVADFGIRTVYLERPSKTLPYTMVMIGGAWTDTNLEDAAAGVAPGTDCGALGQRHVVYTFAHSGWSATGIANVTSQEAGHAWGLDHSQNCGSVMAYCGGGDKVFANSCDGLCEDACQGAAGCRLTHEMFCGEGSDQQNEYAELAWIFGGNEPDIEPPTVEIQEPQDGVRLPIGSDVDLRAVVDDNYGGFGWRFVIEHDGEVIYDQVDYDKDVDPMYRAALNLVNLEPGTYVFTVEAEDHADHITSDTVTVVIEPLDDTGGSSGGDDGDSAGTSTSTSTSTTSGGGGSTGDPTGDGTTTDDSATSGSDTDGTGQQASDEGCGCRADGTGPRPLPLIVLLGLVAWRVRSHRAS